ncbi:cyclophilin-like domain-containing protein [Protomyces lactucae-debilis]|uniref:peptidylprolyl isomerase n=1 Tax=Protomyces lactucae-debilis TaxID=2754530 RepID=A0A1Y2FFG7_PROLT|nr:cyclophilin-like domain-containing protein [Protomyces lactucae-debilis]ORY82661.1 cyclophilin-like domain-containing protein [Protomyces lactucae-debilis]
MVYCFLELSAGPAPIPGKVIFELFDAQVPKTCENFRALCTGELGGELTYKGTAFHRVVKTFTLQGGDTSKTGTGGMNIYNNAQDAFAGEDLYWRDIDEPFLLCAADVVPRSQFFITLRSSPHLNGSHCCFGRVIKGQQILEQISELGVDEEDVPLEPVLIQRAGELAYKGPAAHVQPIAALSSDAQGEATATKAPVRGRSTTRSPSRARARSRSRRRDRSTSSDTEEEENGIESSRPVSRDRRRHTHESRDRRHHHGQHHSHHHSHRSHRHGTASRSRSREHVYRRSNHSPGHTKRRRSRDEASDAAEGRKQSRRGSRDSPHDRSRRGSGWHGRYEEDVRPHASKPGPVVEEHGIVYKGRGKMRYDAREDPRYGRL